jgi:ABC-2 type transport system permease protein
MTLWRLEWLRLVRTGRALALVLTFSFFGLLSPPLARYRDELLRSVGNGLTIQAPPAAPADGLVNYVSNSAQIGLLVFALVAAGALAFDAHRETAIFLRTRVRHPRDLLIVKYAVTVLAGIVAFDVGALLTWAGSVALLGSLPAGGVLVGIALLDVYLAFFAAVVAAVATRTASVVAAAVIALALALSLGVIGVIPSVGPWLPSHLIGSLAELAAGGGAVGYGRALVVTVVVTAGLLTLAARQVDRREI